MSVRDVIDALINACIHFKSVNFKFQEKNLIEADHKSADLRARFDATTTLKNTLNQLGKYFSIRILLLDGASRLISDSSGPELFCKKIKSRLFYHHNAGKIARLPSGVGKLAKVCHRLDDILNRISGTNLRLNTCPLSRDCNFTKLERDYNISLHVYTKQKLALNKFNIEQIRQGAESGTVIRLHLDAPTGKLFLISDENLYFRSFLKRLKIKSRPRANKSSLKHTKLCKPTQ